MGITVSNYKPLDKPDTKALPKTIGARVEKFWKLYFPVMRDFLRDKPIDSRRLKVAVDDAKKCQSLFWNLKHRHEQFASKEFTAAISLAWQHAWELEDKSRMMQSDDIDYKPKACKPGDKGNTVKGYQELLKQWRFYRKKVDGKYGGGMKEAVEAFQKKNSLKVTGIIDSKTAQKIVDLGKKKQVGARELQAVC